MWTVVEDAGVGCMRVGRYLVHRGDALLFGHLLDAFSLLYIAWVFIGARGHRNLLIAILLIDQWLNTRKLLGWCPFPAKSFVIRNNFRYKVILLLAASLRNFSWIWPVQKVKRILYLNSFSKGRGSEITHGMPTIQNLGESSTIFPFREKIHSTHIKWLPCLILWRRQKLQVFVKRLSCCCEEVHRFVLSDKVSFA